ncbi:MAG: antibiotic biosynthesis monooxygenase [Sphingorhabdus sp.]
MILEHALLRVRPGEAAQFEAAMAKAIPLISASPGFQGIEIRPASQEQNLYLLIVNWDDIASHEQGFRKSDRYQQWRDLLHGFYDPMPEVSYFEEPIAV